MSERTRPATMHNPRFLLGHAGELLAEVLERPHLPADLQISRFFGKRRYLGSKDRGFISDTVYAVLRDIIRLRYLLRELLERASLEREAVILVAAHLLDGRRDLGVTEVSEWIRLSIRDLGDIRALVVAADEVVHDLPEPARSAVRFSLPEWFVSSVTTEMGKEEAELLLATLNTQAPIVLRVNQLVTDRDALIQALAAHGIPASPGEWSPDAVILQKRLNAHSVPEFKQGWFELQDEGSQILSLLLDPHPNWKVFDACAGGGGKTLHLAAIMKGRGEVAAHDLSSRRLSEIRPRLKRSGAQNVRVVDHDAYLERRDNLVDAYDAVMIDAPCSGTGVLRRNPGMRMTLDRAMVERIVVQQSEILDEYSRLVKPGGVMLYATCSLLREENEAQVEAFLARTTGWRREPATADPTFVTADGYFRSFPHRHGTDAFFAAMLRRIAD